MKAVPAWLSYSVYRVLTFAVPLAILLSLQIAWWIAAVLAALIGVSLSYLLLRRPREAVARGLYEVRHPDQAVRHPDAEFEDASVDRAAAKTLEKETLQQETLERERLERERQGE